MRRLLRLFSRKATFSDGEIDLILSDEEVADPECGIRDGYLFRIHKSDTQRYAGYVSLRLGESPALYYLGHIGYRIEPEYRGNGYAARACRLMLPLLRRLQLGSIVITNNPENTPSRKTCERLGCTLESIVAVPGEYRLICSGAREKCRYIWRVSREE